MKENFLMSFSKVDSTLRVLIATTAFGMGVDIPNIRWIVHWSPPRLIEDYVQETGRAGRDGLTATALLVYGHLHRTVSSSMKKYGQNFTTCCRKCLFADFYLLVVKTVQEKDVVVVMFVHLVVTVVTAVPLTFQ